MSLNQLTLFLFLLGFIPAVLSQCGCPRTRRSAEGLIEEVRQNGGYKMVGDMNMSMADALLFAGFKATDPARKKWPQNTLIYSVAKIPQQDQRLVRQSLAALTQMTGGCVKFKESQGGVDVYVGKHCESEIGRSGRPQLLSLGPGCMNEHTIQHEFMHALGFYHEHTRPDRDKYVTVLYDKIDSTACVNFEKCAGCGITHEYDLRSVMQYQSEGLGCEGDRQITLLTKSGQVIPRPTRVSQLDIAKIKAYYGCGGGGGGGGAGGGQRPVNPANPGGRGGGAGGGQRPVNPVNPGGRESGAGGGQRPGGGGGQKPAGGGSRGRG